MRTRMRILSGVGLAAAWLWLSGAALAQLGGGGGSSSGGGGGGSSSGGGGGGGGSGGSGSSGQVGSGATQPTSITGDSLLGSFNNAGTMTRGGGTSALSQSNMFSSTYVNPYQQGLLISNGQSFTPISNAGFGQAVFGNISTGSGSRSGSSFGTTGANTGAGRTGSGSSFGGTSIGGSSMFGSSGSTGFGGGSTGFGGGSTGFGGGSAGLRSAGTGQTFAGGSMGPSIGRTGPVIGSALAFSPQIPFEANHRADLQSIVGRSTTTLKAPAGVAVTMDSGAVVLRGTVATPDEKRLVENMLRLHPGVHDVRNELEVRGGGNP